MGTPPPVLRQTLAEARCSDCELGHFCVAAGSDDSTLARLDDLLEIDAEVPGGTHLVRRGDAFDGLFAVRRGCFKSYSIDREGREQVVRFHFPGELIGLEAVSARRHGVNVVALGEGAVCHFDYSELLSLAACAQALQHQLFRLFSDRLAERAIRQGEATADERMAAFLLDISERLAARGWDGTRFELSMSRGDIGNYLGLATETVSRVLTRLRSLNIIDVRRKHVHIRERATLEALAEVVLDR